MRLVRFALVAAGSAVVLGLSASAGVAVASTNSGTVTSGSATASGTKGFSRYGEDIQGPHGLAFQAMLTSGERRG